LIQSAKSDILSVYDNLKLPNTKLEIEEGEFIYLEEIKIHSKNKENFDPYNFVMNYTLDEKNNRITFYIPEDQPNGASARFYATSNVFQERTPGGDQFMSD
jgi:hypothetical protein